MRPGVIDQLALGDVDAVEVLPRRGEDRLAVFPGRLLELVLADPMAGVPDDGGDDRQGLERASDDTAETEGIVALRRAVVADQDLALHW